MSLFISKQIADSGMIVSSFWFMHPRQLLYSGLSTYWTNSPTTQRYWNTIYFACMWGSARIISEKYGFGRSNDIVGLVAHGLGQGFRKNEYQHRPRGVPAGQRVLIRIIALSICQNTSAVFSGNGAIASFGATNTYPDKDAPSEFIRAFASVDQLALRPSAHAVDRGTNSCCHWFLATHRLPFYETSVDIPGYEVVSIQPWREMCWSRPPLKSTLGSLLPQVEVGRL